MRDLQAPRYGWAGPDTPATSSKLISGRTVPWEIVLVVDTYAQVATKAHSFAVATL